MSKCSFPSPSFVQTFRVTTKKEENHISTEFLRMMEIVKFNIPPSLTSVSTTSLNAKAFKSKLFRRLTFDTRSYLIPAQCMVPTFYISTENFGTCEPQSFQHICRLQVFKIWAAVPSLSQLAAGTTMKAEWPLAQLASPTLRHQSTVGIEHNLSYLCFRVWVQSKVFSFGILHKCTVNIKGLWILKI